MAEQDCPPRVPPPPLLVIAHRIDSRLERAVRDLAPRFEVQVGFLEGEAELAPPGEVRRLTVTATGHRLRRLARRAVRKFSGPTRRMHQAARIDSWFRYAVGNVERVIAWDTVAEGALSVVHEFAPDRAVLTSAQATDFLNDQRAWLRLYAALADAGGEDGAREVSAAMTERVDVPAQVDESVDPTLLHGFLDGLLRDERHRTALQAATLAARLPGLSEDDPVLRTVVAACELTEHGHTAIDGWGCVTACLTAADVALAGDRVEYAALLGSLALRLAFHPEAMAPLAGYENAGGRLDGLRGSRVWQLLTAPVKPPTQPRAKKNTPDLEVVVSAGGEPAAHRRMVGALDALPQTTVRSVEPVIASQSLDVDNELIEMRLRAALGCPAAEVPALAGELKHADVLVASGAGKAAMLLSLLVPPGALLVVRATGAEVRRCWFQLVDWSRVAALVIDDEPTAEYATDVLDKRLNHTRSRVLYIENAAGLRETALGDLGRLHDLTAAHRDDEALELIERLVADDRVSLPVLHQSAMSAHAAGAMTLRLKVQEKWRELLDDRRLISRDIRRQQGRLRETSPDWTPTIGGPVGPFEPVPGRILHVLKVSAPYRQSGYTLRSLAILVGQQHHGLEPLGVTALGFPPRSQVHEVPPRENLRGIEHVRLLREDEPDNEPFDAYLDAWATALAEVVQHERPAVIHVHSGNRGYEPALVALAVGEATTVPVVYEVRGFFEAMWTSDLRRAEHGETYERRRETEQRCMRRAAAVVTLGEAMRDDIVARGIAPERVHVVPNGVDVAAFEPQARSMELTKRLGLTDQFVFGYISSLDHYREGHELLIEAAVILRRRGIPATALIVGEGRRLEELREHARSLSSLDFVRFTGRIAHGEVAQYYAQCDVFVIPRVNERAARLVTPLKPFEAMASGVPLVVSDLPALQEIVGDGERGTAFANGSVESLATILEGLYHDPQPGTEAARRARDWVREERSWDKNAARYLPVYASLHES